MMARFDRFQTRGVTGSWPTEGIVLPVADRREVFRRCVAGAGLVWIFLAILNTAPAATPSELPAPQLDEAIEPLVKAHNGRVSYVVRHLVTGETSAVRGEEVMPTASLIKLPVMLTAYHLAAQGKLDLMKPLTYRERDRVAGSGLLGPHFTPGLTFPLRDAIRLMISHSDNVATNMVLEEIGLARTNEQMEAWGFPNTKIHALVFRGETSIAPERSKTFGLGSTTAREMAGLLERLHRQELADEPRTRDMLSHLQACDDQSRLKRYLPTATRIAMKTGSVNASRTVAGIVYSPAGPFCICVLTTDNQDQSWKDENAAQELSARICEASFKYFTRRMPAAESDWKAPLTVGSRGELVADLQRTLNAKLRPSPNLTNDGEFGSATQNALKSFQTQAGLEATGSTNVATWNALGNLIPHPDAAATLQPVSPRNAANGLTGPPAVTAKAWCVGDPNGQIGFQSTSADTPLDFASTTKIMTAYLVLTLAAEHPELLSETLTMSLKADETIGSSAGIRAGEQLTVRETLYGLMLPSGNDVATALAEFCGQRCLPISGASPGDSYDRFIAEMNRTAERLGMSRTTYVNPHGLTHREHKSTACDQFRLAAAALKIPFFRELVNTRQFQCEVLGPSGYRRTVGWRNTNRLLATEGYAGVKTGTTDAAGSCLISLEVREGKEALLVVLGSTSTDARYVDSRNLYRFYWQNLQRP